MADQRSTDRLFLGVWIPVSAKHALVRIAERRGIYVTQLVNDALAKIVTTYAHDLHGSGFHATEIAGLLHDSAIEQSKFAANKPKAKAKPGRPKRKR